jgi:predicted ribosomally synthesized peptide with nif11-like leader
MAEEDLERFLQKVRHLQAFVAASEADPALRQRLAACSHHHDVVELARLHGFEIGRRWGEAEASPRGGASLLAGPGLAPGQELSSTRASKTPLFWRLTVMASPPIPFITVSGLPVASVQFIQNPPRVSSPFSTVRGTTGTLAVTG